MDKTALLFLAGYLFAISAITVAVTVFDKRCAQHHRRRVPERTLFLLALLGGSAAEWITMRVIRHKTLHLRFMLGLPAIFLLQCAAFAVWYFL